MFEKKKTAIVLEGGGMRGLYTAGVLDILMEENIYTDMAIGVSAGCLFGINYKSKQKGRALRYNKKYSRSKNYMGIESLIKTGNIMNKEFCFDKLVNELDPFDFETYKKTKMKFYATVTNTRTGKAEYIEIDDLKDPDQMEYCRASGSIPMVSKMVEVKGEKYLDGAIGDSIPVKKAIEDGYQKIIVVTTRPYDYKMEYKNRRIAKIMYRKYPKFLKAFLNRYKMYNETTDYIKDLEKTGRIVVIRPSKKVPAERLEKNPALLQEAYNLGRSDTKKKIKEIKRYLKG